MTVTQTRASEEADLVTRLTLLSGQAFFLGLSLGLLIIAAFALLLSSYGAELLPWVYITVAIAGSCVFYGFAEAQRRWSLVQVSLVAEFTVVAFLVIAWAGFIYAHAEWLSFLAMVVFPLIIQIGFVIVGGQAGRLLDVRQIKRYFPRVVAGFVVGFMVAGAGAGPLLRIFGRTEHLLLAAAGASTIMLVMLMVTDRRYHAILTKATPTGPQQRPPSLRKVLAKRFILLIFAYQMLSAMATQLIEFMVMAAAAERFTGSDALADFYGRFTFIINLSDLLFLVLVAGLLLSRFGLRFGLTFNPGAVILLLGLIVAAGATLGPLSLLFFGMVLATRILDITFTDGTTRASINATYQALPAHERVSVQTGVEGIGVPMALGLTGVVLLLFGAVPTATLLHVAIFALLVSVLWIICAVFVYRDYATNLLQTMRCRALGPAGLSLDDASMAVVDRLVSGGNLSDIRLGLNVLESASDPSLARHLTTLVTSAPVDIQIEALVRIEREKIDTALPQVKKLAGTDSDEHLQGAALRTLCALEEAEGVEDVVPYLDAAQPYVRLGAAVGLLKYGSIPGILAVSTRLSIWEGAVDTEDRAFLARLIGETGERHFYQPLITLLSDPDTCVRIEALNAAGNVRHPRLLPLLLKNLDAYETRSAASDALVAYGELMLPLVEDALVHEGVSTENIVRLVRACATVKGDAVLSLLRHHIQHPQNVVRNQILSVLSASHYQAQTEDRAVVDEALLHEVRQGHRLLRVQVDVGDSHATAMLQRALAEEMMQVRRRILRLLSFLNDAEPTLRAGTLLIHGVGAEQALAFEMLDVSLSTPHKTLTFPLLDPRLESAQRLQLLDARQNTPSMTRTERLQELSEMYGQPWIRACTFYAIGLLDERSLTNVVETAISDADTLVRETAAWCLHRLAPKQFHRHVATLMADEDPRVAQVIAELLQTTPPRTSHP